MPNLPRFGPPEEEAGYEPGYDPGAEPEIRKDYVPYKGEERPFSSRQELQKLPKTVLLKIAIELDPDAVAEAYQEGWTKDDILRVIERHLRGALGRQEIEGWPYIGNVEVLESSVEEDS